MENKKIAFACDHAGFERKEELIQYLTDKGFEIEDFGCNSTESCDYPDYIHPLAQKVNSGEYTQAIIICGSANGVSMVANKYENVRAALCWETELASLARLHNNANICAIPARFISFDESKEIVDCFLTTDFEGGRHQRRVEKIAR